MQEKILLFIPCYNCEKQIVRVLEQLDEAVMKWIDQVVVVNNRSTDMTEEAIKKCIDKEDDLPIILLRNDENYGLGGSHKVAFQYAIDNDFDYILVLHGDDQGNVKDILPILQSGEYRSYDCCLGARFMKGSKLPGYSAFRTFGNRVYNILFSLVCRRKIYDLGSGLNFYKVDMLRSKYYEKFPDDLTFNCCMLMAIHSFHQNPKFFPISWREEDQVSNVKLFSQAGNTLHMVLEYFIRREKCLKKEWRVNVRPNYHAEIISQSTVTLKK